MENLKYNYLKIHNSRSIHSGGGVYVYNVKNLTVYNMSISNCSASYSGGGLYMYAVINS